MEPRDLGRCNSSANEGHGVHLCRRCGWPFPNPHPSARHRRAHKRVCGTIQGFKLDDYGEIETHLDGDSKTSGLKTMERSISRGSSGVGSRSSRSTRSNEDVFSDAVTDFDDFPSSVDSVSIVGEPDNAIHDVSKDDRVSQLSVEKTIANAGELYPPDKAELETVEFHNPEKERVEVDMPSQHHPSGTNLDSALISVLDSEEKRSTKGTSDEKSEDGASVHTEDSGKTSEAVSLRLMEGGGLVSILADAVTEVTVGHGDGFHDKTEHSPINSLEKGRVEMVLEKDSEDVSSIPSEDTGKTSQEVKADNLEVIEKQVDGFGAKNGSSPKGDFAGQTNGLENLSGEKEDVNVEPGSSFKADEGHGMCSDNVQFVVCSDGLPLREHSGVMLEDRVTENLPSAITSYDAQEGKSAEHVCVPKDVLSSLSSMVEPGESFNGDSEDVAVADATIHQGDNSVEASPEKKLEGADTDTMRLGSAVASFDDESNEVGDGGKFTSMEEQTPRVFVDTNFHSIQPAQDGSENSELSTATEPFPKSNNYITLEKNSPEGIDRGSHDVRSGEVEEKIFEFTSVRQTDDQMDGEEDERNNGHGCEEAAASEPGNASLLEGEFQINTVWDPEAAVKETSSYVEQLVHGDCGSVVSKSAILSSGDSLDMTEQKYQDENCGQKASDLHNVSVTNDDALLSNIEVSGSSKELQHNGERVSDEEFIGNVDFGHISDNDDDSINLTQNTVNSFGSRVHSEAVSSVEDCSSKETTDGRASGFADLDRNLVKQEEAISELDIRADSSSQSDSLECNWGSVSDAPATTDSKSQPSQASAKMEEASLQPKSDNRKSEIFQPPSYMTTVEEMAEASDQNLGVSEVHLSQKPEQQAAWLPSMVSGANEPSGRKREKEIIDKVTNWSTVRQHMPLKSYLGEPSPNAKDNIPFRSPKMKRTTTRDSKETVDEAMMGEWNSPARYPANIKREKGKARNKAWVPFICCSSARTS